MDYGRRISYMALETGAVVISSDGVHVGTVRRVLAVDNKDIFDGLVIMTDGGARFLDAPEVGEIYEMAVIATVTAAEVTELPPHPAP